MIRKVAIVGLGIGAMHLKGWRALPERFEVAVVVDLNAERIAQAQEGGAVEALDFEAMLARPDIDIVDICTPPSLHAPMIEAALKAGKHVVCEKPLLSSLAECDRIAEIAKESGRALMPVFQYRFGDGFRRLRALIDGGLAGKLFLASIETAWSRDSVYYSVPWRGARATEWGGCLITHAIHAHDALDWLVGPITTVNAAATTRVNPIETEDCAVATVTLASGALASLSVTLGAAEEISRLRFHFEGFTAESNLEPYKFGFDGWRFTARSPEKQPAIDRVAAAVMPGKQGFPGQFEAFADALDNGLPPPVTLDDARRSIALLTALYRSARTRETVELPIPDTAPDYRGWL
jgi:predicted dehydrogenase